MEYEMIHLEAMEEDGRNEVYPGKTAWGNPVRPHHPPKPVRQEGCFEVYSGDRSMGTPDASYRLIHYQKK